jgi:hypothetical protein
MIVKAIGSISKRLPASTRLYRYLNSSQLEYFFTSGVTLTRMATWPDRYEAADFEFFQQTQEFQDTRQSENFYASCWTTDSITDLEIDSGFSIEAANAELRTDGSASMWESYCGDGGIRIATTLEKLLSLFELHKTNECSVAYGAVKYCAARDYSRFADLKDIESTFFFKRIGYRHEAEFRFVAHFDENPSDYLSIPIPDYSDFLEEILVFPLKDSSGELLANALHQRGVNIVSGPTTGMNRKNGQQFCRVSQLYGVTSEGIGEVEYLGK